MSTMMRRLLAVGAACCVATACADTENRSLATGGPTPVPAVAANRGVFCTHDLPTGFHAGAIGARVDFAWNAITGITRYQIEVVRSENDRWVPDASLTADGNRVEWYPGRAGSYAARVRSVTGCGTTSD